MSFPARPCGTDPFDWQRAHHAAGHARWRRCVAGVVIGLLVASQAAATQATDLELPDPVAAAAEEASGWPDFDPSDMADEVAETESRLAVAGWPDFDPSDMAREVAVSEGLREAAGWPDYDSTALADPANQIVVASGGPRRTQTAASQAPAGEDAGVAATGRSHPIEY